MLPYQFFRMSFEMYNVLVACVLNLLYAVAVYVDFVMRNHYGES